MNQDAIPDADLYRPTYAPWCGAEFEELYSRVAKRTLIDPERMYVLWSLAMGCRERCGEIWECGVYKGGSAFVMMGAAYGTHIRLFDTFEGIPNAEQDVDVHSTGDFGDTSLEDVKEFLGSWPEYHVGEIPGTFRFLESCEIALAHVDVDTYRSVKDCCEFIWPRMLPGGVMVFDDYGFPSCPGARKAVDEFFRGERAFPVALGTGQALVVKA